jgi:hypothetical protein
MVSRTVLLVGALLIAAGVTGQTLPQGSYRIGDAPPPWRPAISEADLVVASLHDSLLKELASVLADKEPGQALASCHIDLIGTMRRLSGREPIAVGRTSDRLRSEANAPPAWAAPLVDGFSGRRARDVEGFVVDLDDRLGILRPIVEQPVCASCHGLDRARPKTVDAALAARYPRDRATGFLNGEIRGWYWVVIGKPQ